MIIKRTLKFEMPNLKRCKLEEHEGEDEFPYSANKKKRRTNGYYSLCNGDVEGLSSGGSGSWFNNESCWAGEVESNLKQFTGDHRSLKSNQEGFGRSSRGRVRMLPSRFKNSVINLWRKEPKFDDTDTSFDEEDNVEIFIDEDKEKIDGLGFVRKPNKEKYRYNKNSKSFRNGVKEEDSEVGCIGFNNFDEYANYIGLKIDERSFSTMGSEEYASEFRYSGVERLRKANARKRKEIYKPEDFALGDIVWAKCGRSYPAWPAVVIDPILQAPEAVLRCCIPRTICVMFFGFSKNGKQRVTLSFSLSLCVYFCQRD